MKIFAFLVCFVVFSIYETFGINTTYPLTRPVSEGTDLKYRIAIISNNGEMSKVGENKWRSKLLKGWVTVNKTENVVTVKEIKWDQQVVNLYSNISINGRAMEMSELVTFNGKLFACDEATGAIYELINGYSEVKKLVRLRRENGTLFKCRWMTAKVDLLWVGAHDREWIDSEGNKNHIDFKMVKPIGDVLTMSVRNHYLEYREAAGYPNSGYLTIEAGIWSEKRMSWFYQTRTGSLKTGGTVEDETRGDNKLYISDIPNDQYLVKEIGPLENNRGFTSFKFIPNSNDTVFLALKVSENGNNVSTFIEAYDIYGKVLMNSQKIADEKYQALEFI